MTRDWQAIATADVNGNPSAVFGYWVRTGFSQSWAAYIRRWNSRPFAATHYFLLPEPPEPAS